MRSIQLPFVQRARRAVGERLRERLGMAERDTLPAFPSEGLVGDSCVVRPYRREDLVGRLALEKSAGVEWAVMPQIAGREEKWLEDTAKAILRRSSPYQLAVVSRADGRYAGEMFVDRSGTASASYGMAYLPEFRGTDISRESIRLVPEWLLATAFHRLEASHSVENVRAHGALLRAGFVEEGIKRKAFGLPTPTGTVWYDECCHAMVDESA